jgi:hypothetical protein
MIICDKRWQRVPARSSLAILKAGIVVNVAESSPDWIHRGLWFVSFRGDVAAH